MKRDEQWMHRISTHDFVLIDQCAYFFALNFNALYRIWLTDRKMEFLGSVPGEDTYKRHIYGAIVEAGGKLYLPPMNGNEIAVYDIENKVFEKIPLKYEANGMASKFYGALSVDNRVFLIPARYPYLVVINVEEQSIIYLNHWLKDINVPKDYKELYVKNGFFVRNGLLYMASQIDNTLIKVSLKDYETELVSVGQGTDGFMDMCEDRDGENIWFVQRRTPSILKWNEKSGDSVEYCQFPDKFENKGFPFINILEDEKYVYAVAYQTNMSLEIDKKSGALREAKWDKVREDSRFNDWHARHYFGKRLPNKKWLLANIDDNSFYIMRGGKLIDEFFLINYGDWELDLRKEGFLENEKKSLGDYLDFVKYRM